MIYLSLKKQFRYSLIRNGLRPEVFTIIFLLLYSLYCTRDEGQIKITQKDSFELIQTYFSKFTSGNFKSFHPFSFFLFFLHLQFTGNEG